MEPEPTPLFEQPESTLKPSRSLTSNPGAPAVPGAPTTRASTLSDYAASSPCNNFPQAASTATKS